MRTPIGRRVAQIGQPKSGVQRIAEAVSWIRAHFAQPVTVEDMASSVHMSASSFHQRFKAITSMSPLQYQKVLRLHEARRLMLFQRMDASDACRRVGYVSPSQFSREYSRFFGSAPVKDIARLREEGFASVGRARSRVTSVRGTVRGSRSEGAPLFVDDPAGDHCSSTLVAFDQPGVNGRRGVNRLPSRLSILFLRPSPLPKQSGSPVVGGGCGYLACDTAAASARTNAAGSIGFETCA